MYMHYAPYQICAFIQAELLVLAFNECQKNEIENYMLHQNAAVHIV